MLETKTLDFTVGEFATNPDRFAGVSISEMVRHWSETIPDETAFVTPESRVSWKQYDAAADAIASALDLAGEGYGHVAVLLPDTAVFHAALCAAFRTGRVAVGIGSRSGIREISHLIARSEASVLVTTRTLRGVDTAELVASLRAEHPGLDVVFADERADVSFERVSANGELTSLPVELKQFPATSPCFVTSAVSMLNSTSGTTGLPNWSHKPRIVGLVSPRLPPRRRRSVRMRCSSARFRHLSDSASGLRISCRHYSVLAMSSWNASTFR